jgi:DNA-binding GntR family transcriptional regulator
MRRNIAISRPPSLAGAITERLRAAITNGEFAPGEALSEDTLAAELGTSRTPVREALNTLQFQGLVTVIPQRGTFVFSPTANDVSELCDFRATLEVKAARLALARHRDAALVSLQDAFAAMTTAQTAGDDGAYARADSQFHEAFFTHCGNQYLSNAYLLASGRVGALRAHLSAHVTGEPTRSFAEHRDIIALWGQGDGEAIEKILTEHIMRTEVSYLKALRAGQIAASLHDAATRTDAPKSTPKRKPRVTP